MVQLQVPSIPWGFHAHINNLYPPAKRTWHWKTTIFNRRSIFIHGYFSSQSCYAPKSSSRTKADQVTRMVFSWPRYEGLGSWDSKGRVLFVLPSLKRKVTEVNWLVVPTHLKNIRQMGNLPQVGMKIKKYLKPPPSKCDGWDPFKSKTYEQLILVVTVTGARILRYVQGR